jgi:hypothetical protein
MLLTILLLATLMAIMGVIGYFQGARAAFLLTIAILLGLLLIARAGGTIAKLVNGIYFGIQFVLAGGLQALGSGGTAGLSQVLQNMGTPQRLIDPNAPGPTVALVILLVAVLLAWLLGRASRLPFRGARSGWGILWGLVNGYLLGAYLLWAALPSFADSLPVPFGLAQENAANATTATGVPAAGAAGASVGAQLLNLVQTANEHTLAVVIMILIATFVIVAAYVSTRGGGRSRRNGTG